MSSSVPTLDFGLFTSGSTDDRKLFEGQVDDALRSVGFFQLRNHGIPQSRIETCFELSKKFFDMPSGETDRLTPIAGSFGQGYYGIGREKVRDQICRKESFDFSNPSDSTSAPWPSQSLLPGFRDIAAEFYNDCSRLNRHLLECLATCLRLDSKHLLNECHGGSMFMMSLLHYPAVATGQIESDALVRNAAHADFGTLTLLFQRDVGGLQVADMSSTNQTSSAGVNNNAVFMDIEPDPQNVVVNPGFLLRRWTNDRWKNAVHRVVEPSVVNRLKLKEACRASKLPSRYSIAFFSYPDAETEIEPFETCCNEETPKKWGSLNAGEYLARKRAKVYGENS